MRLRAQITVIEDIVSFADELEMLRGLVLHVGLHLVWVEEQGLSAVGAFDVVFGGAWVDVEELVVVWFVILHYLGS